MKIHQCKKGEEQSPQRPKLCIHSSKSLLSLSWPLHYNFSSLVDMEPLTKCIDVKLLQRDECSYTICWSWCVWNFLHQSSRCLFGSYIWRPLMFCGTNFISCQYCVCLFKSPIWAKVQHIFRKPSLVLCSLIYDFKCSLVQLIILVTIHWNSFLLLWLMKCYIRMLLPQLLRTSYQVLESRTQHLTSYFELSTKHFKDWLQRLKTLLAIFCCYLEMVWQKSCQSSIVSFLCIACGWGYKKYRDSKMQICSICSPIWDTPIALFYWDIYVNEIKFDIEVCRLSTL